MCKVSVIIPIYNVEKYLKKCLDSVINQTYKNLEIICVNDCSLDNSLAILEEYAKKDNRIKIINKTLNEGLSAARNTGLDVASGEYLYHIDSDDWIDLDYIEKMVNAAKKSNAKIVLNTNIYTCNEFGENKKQASSLYSLPNVKNEFINAQENITNVIWNTVAHLWKKSFVDDIQARFPEKCLIEDVYFQATTYPYVDKIFVIKESSYNYFQRDNSIIATMKHKQQQLEQSLCVLKQILKFYKEHDLLKQKRIRILNQILLNLSQAFNEEIYSQIKSYYEEIEPYVRKTIDLYNPVEVQFFNAVLSSYKKTKMINWRKNIVFDKLRSNLNKGF